MKRGSAPELVVRGDHADRPVARRSSARRGPSAARRAGRAPGRPRRPRGSSRRARSAAARARARSSSASRARHRPDQLLGVQARRLPRSAGRRRRRGARSPRARRRSARAAASRSARAAAASSVSPASAFPTSVSDSSWREPARRRLVQARVLDRDGGLGREQRDELLVLAREVLAALPSRSGRGSRRRRRGAGSARRGTSASAGGAAGSRPSAGRSSGRAAGAAAASLISTPRIPRPCGRSPIRSCVSASMPVVRKRSSARPDGSITPSAAYRAPVSSAAASTMRCSTRVERELRRDRDAGLDQARASGLPRQTIMCRFRRQSPRARRAGCRRGGGTRARAACRAGRGR